ncbi:MAG: hypothetical protein IJ524_05560 [Bacteroidales bacterium]|nr:hypothetical protein [Bacteroidales bacterium]
MKRIAIIVVMVLMGLTASATSIRYFTYAQASRTVQYLNAQQEMMIYCGYDYEIETYVLINEVWMERINSAYYELWVYGYDAYTGDEIYMPLDLQCVWLYSGGRMYNAAQYLRFHATVRTPSFAWFVPPYNPYTRRLHMAGYVRSYHYDIHRHGWMPPAPPLHGYGPNTQPPLPPYYMRTPQTPPPAPTQRWTPGMEHPQVQNSNTGGVRSTGAVPTTRPSASGTATPGTGTTTRSGNSRSTESGTTTTTRSTGSRTAGTESSGTVTPSRGTSTEGRTTTTTRSTATTPTRTNTGVSRSSEGSTGQGSTTTTRTGSTRTSGTSSTTTTTRSGNSRTTGGTTTTSSSRTSGSSRTATTGTSRTSTTNTRTSGTSTR